MVNGFKHCLLLEFILLLLMQIFELKYLQYEGTMLHCYFDDGQLEAEENNRRFLMMPFGPCAPLVSVLL